VLAFDVGGANTKAAYLTLQGKEVSAKVAMAYFPVWKAPHKLPTVLLGLKERLGANKLDVVGVTLTAELSDAYQTKREGVAHILGCIKDALPQTPIYVLNTDAQMEPLEAALAEPLGVAAANWAATGWLVAQHIQKGVVIDVGSTSTSIIPIKNGQVTARGKTDLEKLVCGELVYTGSLRTNVATIVKQIPLEFGLATVSSELFALSGDVHLILGHISEEEYVSETADGRGKTVSEAMARLARVVCADTQILSYQEITKIAQYIYRKQVAQITFGLRKVYMNLQQQVSGNVPVVITGLGKDFLAKKAAIAMDVEEVLDLAELVEAEAVLATPAYAVALMTTRKLQGDAEA
jgi:probable H4MPT-linked C1 transfer pathway protein